MIKSFLLVHTIIYFISLSFLRSYHHPHDCLSFLLKDFDELSTHAPPHLRNLQSPGSSIYKVFMTSSGQKLVWGNKIIYDQTLNKIFSVQINPDSHYDPTALVIFAFPPNARNANGVISYEVHANPCNIKLNGQSANYIPTNLVQLSTHEFVVFTNHNVSRDFQLQCGADNIDMIMLSYANAAFQQEKYLQNLMSNCISSGLGPKFNGLTFFQVRASAYMPVDKIAALILAMNNNDDASLPATKIVYMLAIIDPKSNPTTNPVKKYFIIDIQQMISVRNIYILPNSDVVYFVVQEGTNSFFVGINVQTTADKSTIGANMKQQIGQEIFNGESNFDVHFDPTSNQFIHVFATNIQGPFLIFTAWFFQLQSINPTVTIGNKWNKLIFYQGDQTLKTTNAVRIVSFISPFLILCDYYACNSFKLNDQSLLTLGYDRTFNLWSSISTELASIMEMTIYASAGNDDVFIWTSGYLANGSNFIGNSYVIPESCLFYSQFDIRKCSVKCSSTHRNEDSVKLCVPACPSTSPFYTQSGSCSTSCEGLWQVNILYGAYICVQNSPCPSPQLYLSYKTGVFPYITVYNQCVPSCPSSLFTDLVKRECVPTCDTQLYESSKYNGYYISQCVRSCPSGFVNADDRAAPPFRCATTPGCRSKKIVKPNPVFFRDILTNACVDSCPSGTYLDAETQRQCIACQKNEGYLYDNLCYSSCPFYRIPQTSEGAVYNSCINCKDLDYYWYESNCWDKDTIPVTVDIVEKKYNAVKKCSDVGKLVYNNTCIMPPCPSDSYAYKSNSNFCYRLVDDNKYLYLNNSVDQCPEGFTSNDARICLSCKDSLLYEYQRQCVKECPEQYWANEENNACILCTDGDSGKYIVNADYVDKCVIPSCPSNAYVNVSTRKCIYCKNSNSYMLSGTCVTSCPYNSKIDLDKFECAPCMENDIKGYFYHSLCYSECPSGTIPTIFYTCIESNPNCTYYNPCQNNSTCKVIDNHYQCNCTNSNLTGQYCHLTLNYTDSFYSSFTIYIYTLLSNYTRYSSVNPVIISLNPSEVAGMINFLQLNYPTFDDIAIDLIDKVVKMMGTYLTALTRSKVISFSPHLFYVEDLLLNITESVVVLMNQSTSNSTGLRMLVNVQQRVNNIKEQIREIAIRILEYNINVQETNTFQAAYKHFNIAHFYSSGSIFENFVDYFIQHHFSYFEYPDCEASLRSKYDNITTFPGYKIDWNSHLTNLDISNNFDKIFNANSFEVVLYNTITGKYVYPAYECSQSAAITPFFARFALDFSSHVNLTLYDYYMARYANVYNKDSRFFKDRCYIFVSDDLFDVTLKYRMTHFAPNINIQCSDGCMFLGIDTSNYTICKCISLSSSEPTVSLKIIKYSYNDTSGNNLQITSCIQEVLSSQLKGREFRGNYGIWTGVGAICIFGGLLLLIYLINLFLLHFRVTFLFFTQQVCHFDANFYPAILSPFETFTDKNENYHEEPSRSFADICFIRSGINSIPPVQIQSANANKTPPRDCSKKNENQVLTLKNNRIEEVDIRESSNIQSNNGMFNDYMEVNIFEKFFMKADTNAQPMKLATISLMDATTLPPEQMLVHDPRSCATYYFDCLVKYHSVCFAFLHYSFLYPFYIRVLLFLTGLSLEFGLNAMLFSDDYLDLMYNMKTNYSFDHVLRYQFDKCVFAIVISYIPLVFLRCYLLKPSPQIAKKFNEFLISKQYSYMLKGYTNYKNQMRSRHILTILICAVIICWMWLYQSLFCGIYINTQLMWIYGGIVTSLINSIVVQGVIIPAFLTLIREIARRKISSSGLWFRLYNIFQN